jgi:predicted ATPase
MARQRPDTKLPPPFLKRAWLPGKDERDDWPDGLEWDHYPLNLPLIRHAGLDISFTHAVTILVGENGSGKSTVLEAVAQAAGFSDKGGAVGMGAVDHAPVSGADGGLLGQLLRTAWLPQVKRGWFFRAETFFTVARYLDQAAHESGFAGPQFLTASHGEGFFAFFEERLKYQGIYILDEPESALSPARQFDFLKLLRRMQRDGRSQVIMATHSPILMALPGADLQEIDRFGLRRTTLEDTAHFRLYREFIRYPHETVEAMTD